LGLLLLCPAGCQLIQPGPTADFAISPVVLYAGETFELDGSLSLGSAAIVSYAWALSDGQSLAGQQVNASFPFPGVYSVTLTVEDANGHADHDTQQLVVYARTGTVILDESFSDGETALARWVLDPTWASAGDAQIDFIQGTPGNALYIRSAAGRWHRRYRAIELPPLRVGQKAVFSCRIMTLRNQDLHTFLFAPGRPELGSLVGALPYFLFTNEGDGSYVQVPTLLGTDVGHPISYEPDVYRWHTYTFKFDLDSYELLIDDDSWMEGPLDSSFSDRSVWIIVIGEESLTETCNAYFDDIRVTIEE
jgi:PKD repeat protein